MESKRLQALCCFASDSKETTKTEQHNQAPTTITGFGVVVAAYGYFFSRENLNGNN